MKKILIVFLLVALVTAFAVSVNKTFAMNGKKGSDGFSNRYVPLSQFLNKTSLRDYALKRIPKGAKLISVEGRAVYFDNTKNVTKPLPENPTSPRNSVTPKWGHPHYYITNVRGPYKTCGVYDVGTANGGPGPTTIHLSETKTVSNSFSANVGVSADVVSAGVGFNVTASQSITYSDDLFIPLGKYGEIDAHPIYDTYTYDVMYNPLLGSPYKVGEGEANKATGVYFVTYTWSE